MNRARSSWIEACVYALIAGTLLSRGLRDAATIALVVLIVAERLFDGRDTPRPPPHASLVAWFLLANLVAALRSDHAPESLEALRFYPLGVLLYFGSWRVAERGGMPRLATIIAGILGLIAADVIWQYLTGTSFLRPRMASLERYRGSLAQPTDVSMLPILLPFAATRMTGVVASLVAMASVLSGTRAAFGATILATAALTVFSGKRSAKLGAWLFTVILATALLGAATAPRRLFSIDTYAHEGRVAQWRAASVLFLESPLIGNGPHVFREQCADRAASDPTSVFAEIDLSSAPYPHQIYLEVLAGSGVLGFLPFVMLLAMPLRSAREAYRPALAAALFALVGLVDMSLKNDWVQLCFWLPIGCAEGLRSRRSLSAAVADEAPGDRRSPNPKPAPASSTAER